MHHLRTYLVVGCSDRNLVNYHSNGASILNIITTYWENGHGTARLGVSCKFYVAEEVKYDVCVLLRSCMDRLPMCCTGNVTYYYLI